MDRLPKELRSASDLYREEADVLGPVFNEEDAFWRRMNDLRKACFTGVWRDTPIDAWTREAQLREKEIMEEALQIEESAIRMIEEALSEG